ncbi:MAG: hypothetical protein GY725_07985, partial [bacterium]|nr:hypothetical protein [bacterium]
MNQILAIAELQFKTLLRRARGATRVVNTIVATLMVLFGLAFAILIAAVFAAMIWSSTEEPEMLRISLLVAFYCFFVFGVIFPVFRGAIEQGLDLRRFRVFPIPDRRLFWITLTSTLGSVDHAVYYPALISVSVAMILWADAGIVVVATVSLLMLVTYVSWSFAINLALAEMTRTRRVREIIAILAFVLLIGASFSPQLFFEEDGAGIERNPILSAAARGVTVATSFLPPDLATAALTEAHRGASGGVAWRVAAIALWAFSGLALGYWIFTRYHLADRVAPNRRKQTVEAPDVRHRRALFSFDNRWLAVIPLEVRAVASKELRYLLRSVNGRFVLLAMPFFIIVIGHVFSEAYDMSFMGMASERVLLFGLLLYSVFMSNSFVNNAFAWEGDGIKAYYLSPVALDRVILGKNLGVFLYNGIILMLALACWVATMGFPGVELLASSILLFCVGLLVFVATGNVVSVLFPVSRNISSMMNSPSQTAFLLSVVTLGIAASVASLGIFVSLVLG